MAYQGAMEAVLSILVGAGLGALADRGFDTGPRYLMVGLVIGFGAFILRIARLARQLSAMTEESADAAATGEPKPGEDRTGDPSGEP